MPDDTRPKPDRHTLAHKIDRLFTTMRPRHREEYTLQEVVEGIRTQGGPTISPVYLWQLRAGTKDNPTKQHLEALARFFGVDPAYFFDERAGEHILQQLDLLAAMRDAGVQNFALRVSELNANGQHTAAVILEELRRLQGLPHQPTPTSETEHDETREQGDNA